VNLVYLPCEIPMGLFFLDDSSFGATKIFHVIDNPHEIRARSRKFKLFHEIG